MNEPLYTLRMAAAGDQSGTPPRGDHWKPARGGSQSPPPPAGRRADIIKVSCVGIGV
jgi:hypothetical protein